MTRLASILGFIIALGIAPLAREAPAHADAYADAETAFQAQSAGDPERAIEYYSRAIRSGELSDRNLTVLHTNRGTAYNATGRHHLALDDFDAALRFDPDYIDAWQSRGNAHSSMGEHDLAIRDYSRALRLDPLYALAWHGRGNTYSDQGQYARAIQDYNEALRLAPGYVSAWNRRAQALTAIGQYTRALGDYGVALRLDPNHVEAWNGRGNAQAGAGRYAQAVASYGAAIIRDPRHAAAYQNRGRVLFILGHFAEAAKDLARSLEFGTLDEYAPLWLYLATARAGDNARPALAEHAQRREIASWPGALYRYHLGTADAGQVLAAAGDGDTDTQKQNHCGAYFHFGQRALEANNIEAARQHFLSALETSRCRVVERASARAELARLDAR
jgi:tetratricopeptide (TPR) repeat protein